MKKKDFKQWTKGMDKAQLKAELMNELNNLDHLRGEIEIAKDCWKNCLTQKKSLKQELETLHEEIHNLRKSLNRVLNENSNLQRSLFGDLSEYQSPTDIWKERFEKEEELEKAQKDTIQDCSQKIVTKMLLPDEREESEPIPDLTEKIKPKYTLSGTIDQIRKYLTSLETDLLIKEFQNTTPEQMEAIKKKNLEWLEELERNTDYGNPV